MSFIRRKFASKDKLSASDNESEASADDSSKSQVKTRIAIIGSGVAGLTCAHYLAADHEVTVFEASDYIGGHVNTIDVALQYGKKAKEDKIEKSAIDTGFIVFNERTYPNFFRLLHELQVPFQSTDMSFSVKNIPRNFEYNGHTINTLLSQRKNVLNPKFWQFVKDIVQFNKHIRKLRQDYDGVRAQGGDISALTQQTLGDYLANERYGRLFTDNYLLPMVSAIWSTSIKDVHAFPLVFFAQFFDNHGLLDVVNRPQWFTIKGGSKQYVNKLVTKFVKAGGIVRVNTPVQSVTRSGGAVTLNVVSGGASNQESESEALLFDEVIFACHADTALKLLVDASPDEQDVLSHFRFTENTAVLHTDSSVLPKKSLAWASWNYLIDKQTAISNQEQRDRETPTSKPVLTYHMNILQRLTKQHNYLVTLNHDIDPAQVIKNIDYSHPVFDNEMIAAQGEWARISGSGLNTHFCGAYWFNGFHEDGVRSGLRVCQSLGHSIEIKDEVDASHLPDSDSTHTPFRYRDLPVKADKQARKLKKRLVATATTNQELVDYVAKVQATVIDRPNKSTSKKRGFFFSRKV